jgi:hypothetical protein
MVPYCVTSRICGVTRRRHGDRSGHHRSRLGRRHRLTDRSGVLASPDPNAGLHRVARVADLAALRDAVGRLGADPSSIDAVAPVDLVIDHSI